MNNYYATVVRIGSDVEEEVELNVNDLDLVCFAGLCPYQIEEGVRYPVAFELMIVDDFEIEELEGEGGFGLERIGNGFSYWIKGVLHAGVIDCGVRFEDEALLDYSYLEDKVVRLKVDRIDVEFLEE